MPRGGGFYTGVIFTLAMDSIINPFTQRSRVNLDFLSGSGTRRSEKGLAPGRKGWLGRQSEREQSECDSERSGTAQPGSWFPTCPGAHCPADVRFRFRTPRALRTPSRLPVVTGHLASHSLRSRSDLRSGAESASGQRPVTHRSSSKSPRFSRSSELKFQVSPAAPPCRTIPAAYESVHSNGFGWPAGKSPGGVE